MFDLGIQELILIFVVALLVFGPKKLPELSRALGRGVRELKIALRGVRDSFDEAESQIEESIKEETQVGTSDEGKDQESAEAGTEQSNSDNYGEDAGGKIDNG